MIRIRSAVSASALVCAAALALSVGVTAPAAAQPSHSRVAPDPVEELPALPGGAPEQQSTMPEGEFTPPTPPQPAPPAYTPLPAPPTVHDRYPDGIPLSDTPQSVIDARAARFAAGQSGSSAGPSAGGAASTARGTSVTSSPVQAEGLPARVVPPRVVAWNMRALLHEKTRMLPRGRIAYY